jgi:hypothetical protein
VRPVVFEPLDATRAHVELWARHMEERQGLATSTVARRPGTTGLGTRLASYIVTAFVSGRLVAITL